MSENNERFLDLSKVCTDVQDLMRLADHVPVIDCPHCVEGWVPDTDVQPQIIEVMPGMVVLDITPKPCDECDGTGWQFWVSEN
jgi:hypothetical protein